MRKVKSGGFATVTRVFIVTAALELGAGVGLLVAPAAAIGLLFGPSAAVFPAVGIARLTGAALLSLGAACWWARADERSTASRALVGALLVYNVAVVVLGLFGTLGGLGPLQLAAVVLHAAQAIGAPGSSRIGEAEDRAGRHGPYGDRDTMNGVGQGIASDARARTGFASWRTTPPSFCGRPEPTRSSTSSTLCAWSARESRSNSCWTKAGCASSIRRT